MLFGSLLAHTTVAAPPPMVAALVVLGLLLRSRGGAAVVVVSLAWLNTTSRDVEPQAALVAACDQPLVVHGELAEPWRDDEVGSAALFAVDSFGPPGTSPTRAGGVLLRVVVRGALRAKLPRAGAMTLLGRCEPGSAWRNSEPIETNPRLVVPSAQLVEVVGPARSARGRLATWRGRLLEEVLDSEPTTEALALARVFVLGDRDALSPSTTAGFQRLGLGHLLSVSGLHVSLVASVVAMGCWWWRPRPRLALAAVAVVLYAFVAGPSPPVLRSAAMALTAAASLALAREPRAGDALAWSLVMLLVLDPAVLTSLAFQLTGAATAGILWFGVPWARRLLQAGAPQSWLTPLAVPIAAQVATLPWAVGVFCRVHPASPLFDLVAVPVVGLLIPLGALWVVLAATPLGPLVAVLLGIVAKPLLWLCDLPASPWVSSPIALPWAAALVLVGVWGWALRRGGRRRWLVACLVGGASAGFLPAAPRGAAEMVVLDVGQGSGVLVRHGGEAILVDGGGWSQPGFGQRVLVPSLARLGVRRLDAVVATHGDRDHCGGLVDLTREVVVNTAFVPAGVDDPCLSELASQVAHTVPVAVGDAIGVGALRLRVLGPPRGAAWATGNDVSVVLAVEGFGRRLLLPGDIERRGELALVVEDPGRCDLLLVPHHGSGSSTGSRLLAAIRPRLAVVSAGRRNSYGHPAVEVLDRLSAARVRVLRTDHHGMVSLTWNELWWRLVLATDPQTSW